MKGYYGPIIETPFLKEERGFLLMDKRNEDLFLTATLLPLRFWSGSHGSWLFSRDLMRRVCMIFIMCCLLFLGGCTDIHYCWPAKFPDRSNILFSKDISRSEMHKLLGKPIATSRYWGVDLFRDTSSESDATFVLIVIIPSPVGIFTDDINQYILVAYDQNDVAMGRQIGIHRAPSHWRPPVHCKDSYPDPLILTTGDFTFEVDKWDPVGTLLATTQRRDAYLALAKTSPYCTAVVGCRADKCTDTFRVDREEAISLLPRGTMWGKDSLPSNSIVAIPLSPGEHVLEVSDRRFGGKGSITISCGKGDVIYFATDSEKKPEDIVNMTDAFLSGLTFMSYKMSAFDWSIKQIEENIPEFLADRPLVIWRGGKWILNPEPGNLDTFSGQ
jgi:hypothetical protein